MKTINISIIAVAILLMFAGCGKKNSNDKGEGNSNDAREGFTMTIIGHEFASNITATNLKIDWGDGTIETFEACVNRSIKHTYKESKPHIVTITADSLTKLEISGYGGPLLYDKGSKITSLDVSRCTNLIHLDCSSNQLADLDVSNNTQLEILNCSNNLLVNLDVNNNTQLKELDCSRNQLTKLDVSKNGNLITLWCNINQLAGLNLSKKPELSELNCRMNQLTNLIVSKNPKLKIVDCGNNELPAKAINAIFNDLPKNLCGRIDLAGNPGNNQTSDAFVAERKGWRVFFYENYGAIESELIAYEHTLEQSAEEEAPDDNVHDNRILLKQASSDFLTFIKKFFADEDNYQISHIQFPLTSNVSDVDLERKDWCSIGWGHILEGEVEVGNITYRGSFGQPDKDQYVYTLYNGSNFIYILIFEKINGKWLLTEFRLGGD